MYRKALHYLKTEWLTGHSRKPLVIRGARQVGKTWLVRQLAIETGKTLIELNFEKQPSDFSFFESNDPKKILLHLSAKQKTPIDIANSILFLDEIQAVPEILAKLRWFAEDLLELPVVAAGSLLEFVLAKHTFSMPVGRISYLHLEPLSFEEFLQAIDQKTLCDYLSQINFIEKLPLSIHKKLLSHFKEYVIVGGLPAVVSAWSDNQNLSTVSRVHQELLATYRDDFSKYHGRIEIQYLDETLSSVPKMLGKKFIYSRVNNSIQSGTIKNILGLLEKARICHAVNCVHANGIPLAAEMREKFFKEIVLDVGLSHAILGINLQDILNVQDIMLINSGAISEQVVGQLLRTIFPFYVEPALYYWSREEKNANAELDYIIQESTNIIPIEVKAGATGSLKSLHYFMGLKKYPLALRVNSDLPSKTAINVKNNDGTPARYTLLSVPFYLVEQIRRLLGCD